MSRLAAVALIALSFSACTQVQVIAPNPRVEPPELRGERGITIEANVSGAHLYRATDEGGQRPPDLDSPRVSGNAEVSPAFVWSPAQPVALGVEVSPLGRGGSLIAKFQPLGEGTRAAEVGDIPLGFYVRVGSVYGQESGDQQTTFGAGGYPWKGVMRGYFAHAGVSTGYRVDPHVLIYAGGALGQYWLDTQIDQSAGSGDQGGVYKRFDLGHAYTAGAGGLFNWKHVQFYVSGEFTHIQYRHAGLTDDPYLHAGVYFTPR